MACTKPEMRVQRWGISASILNDDHWSDPFLLAVLYVKFFFELLAFDRVKLVSDITKTVLLVTDIFCTNGPVHT